MAGCPQWGTSGAAPAATTWSSCPRCPMVAGRLHDYLAEGKGPKDSDGSGKTAFAQARLVRQLHISERDLRLFAADCAEHVLPIFKRNDPTTTGPARPSR